MRTLTDEANPAAVALLKATALLTVTDIAKEVALEVVLPNDLARLAEAVKPAAIGRW